MRNRRMHHRPGFGPDFGPESGGGNEDGVGGRRRSGRGGGGGGRPGKRRGGPGRRDGEGRRRDGRPDKGKRGRARRGEARIILLDVLRDGPKHGYEIIKTFEERSGGEYIPSPGTVYPTLQLLEDQGLVASNEGSERRTYQLTKEGEAELENQAELIAAFWSRFEVQDNSSAQPEVGFLEEELEHLNRVVWSGLRSAISEGNQAQIREVRQAVESCQSQIRDIISGGQKSM